MDNKQERIMVANVWKTPDGTILESKYVHDFVQYHDKMANDDYFIDGGMEYVRYSVNDIPMENRCLYSTDPIEQIRNWMWRGTFDENGDRIYIRLKNMTNQHLENCIMYNFNQGMMADNYITIQYIRELAYRFDHNIYVEEHAYTEEDAK